MDVGISLVLGDCAPHQFFFFGHLRVHGHTNHADGTQGCTIGKAASRGDDVTAARDFRYDTASIAIGNFAFKERLVAGNGG